MLLIDRRLNVFQTIKERYHNFNINEITCDYLNNIIEIDTYAVTVAANDDLYINTESELNINQSIFRVTSLLIEY